MKRRDFLKIGSATLAGLAVSGLSPDKAFAEDRYKLKYDSYISDGALPSKLSEWFFEQLQSRSQGRVEMQYYWAQSLSKAGQNLHAVASGIAETSLIPPGYYQSQLPISRGLSWYYRVQHSDALMLVCRDLYQNYQPLRDEWEKRHNAKVLYWTNWYYCPLITKQPVKAIGELKGKRIRAYGATAEVIKNLGALPVPMPASEVYTSLERGVIDGAIGFEFVTSINYGLHEPAPYYTDIGLGANAPTPVIMNMDTWQSLPADIQETAELLAEEIYQHQYVDIYSRAAEEHVKRAAAEGVHFSKWNADMIAEAEHRVQKSQLREWISDVAPNAGADGTRMQDLINELIQKHDPKGRIKTPYEIYQRLS